MVNGVKKLTPFFAHQFLQFYFILEFISIPERINYQGGAGGGGGGDGDRNQRSVFGMFKTITLLSSRLKRVQ